LFTAVLTALAAMASCCPIASAQTWTNFQVGGVTRKALVHVPDGIDKPPLLISLHGMGIGAGWHQGEMMKLEPIADREKFIVVYPEADQDLRWDLGGTHDIDFIVQIIEDMAAQHDIDRSRVYASGFSMGGMFSYTLACTIPDKIAAIAPGNGYPLGGLFGCEQDRPVPIFHMHGTADDFVKYSGIHAFLESKISEYGCPTVPIRTEPYPASNPSSQSFKEHWGPCTNGSGQTSEVVLVSVTGMIHDWATAGKPNANEDPAFSGKPFDIDGSEEAWAFLKMHSLDEAGAGSDRGAGMEAGTGGVTAAGTSGSSGAAGAGNGGVGASDWGAGIGGMMSPNTGGASAVGAGAGGTLAGGGGAGGVAAAGGAGLAGAAGQTPSGAAASQPSRSADSGGCRVGQSSRKDMSAAGSLLLALALMLELRARKRRVVEARSRSK
jgi:poly(3-hydroxybutyrate) depolymerase